MSARVVARLLAVAKTQTPAYAGSKKESAHLQHSLFLCKHNGYTVGRMKIVALYRPNSEFARKVESFVRDFSKLRGGEIELVSLDTREGADMARLYGIVQYPAILAIQRDSSLAKEWQGDKLPLMDEVASYMMR